MWPSSTNFSSRGRSCSGGILLGMVIRRWLLLHVPVWLATAHQGGAVLLLTAMLFLGHVQLRQ